MEVQRKKCCFKEHKEIDANVYCIECQVYMCNKCENFHSKLFESHRTFSLENNLEEISTGFCMEKGHNNGELSFFCKTHNQLCCAVYLCKIKINEIGRHKDCDTCLIKDIKNEKLNKLKDNIKCLEDFSITLEESINNLKTFFDNINQKKEELKLAIQKAFTKIRNELNNREDQLLLEVENQFESLYFKEEFIKESEKLPKKIKISLEKGKRINKEFKENNLNIIINDCINIENNINDIKIIQEKIKKYKDFTNVNIKFNSENEVNKFIESIKKFGKVEKIGDLFEDNSLICCEENEIKFITKFIEMIKPKSKLKLIFRASIDGKMGKDFHSKCDNIFPTIVFYKTNSNKKFGGYTEANWNITTYGADNNAFIFSINKEKYYKVNQNSKYSIYSDESRGPNFDELWLQEPFFDKSRLWENSGDHACFPKVSDYEMSDNDSVLLELEVFQIV